MPELAATKKLYFCAAHRLYKHESKCANIHGHNYVAEITVRGIDQGVDTVGRVIDFSVIKERVGKWIDENWDHALLLDASDPLVELFEEKADDQLLFVFTYGNPTAENMAKHLFSFVCPSVLGDEIRTTHVRIWETDTCYAEVR